MPRDDFRRNKNEVIPSDSGRDISQDKQNNRISDPDLPPGMAGIDKETYLRLRSVQNTSGGYAVGSLGNRSPWAHVAALCSR